MAVKHEILTLLEQNRNTYLSGEYMAEMLGVSRAAVWKAMRSLMDDGHEIEGIPHRGYRLLNDRLSQEAISLHLRHDVPVHVFDTVGSTNREAQKMASEGAPHGTCVLAESQSAGRGRLGRSFFSPSGSGIYMSVVIHPTFDISKSVLITAAASVAVSRAIEKVTGNIPEIKWVNDIYICKKKVCGILTQAVTDFESGQIGNVIVGIGINCRETALPKDIKDIAGIVSGDYSRNELAAEVIDNLLSVCENIEDRTFIEYYRDHSMIIGEDINVIPRDQEPVPAHAYGIDDDGGLLIRYEDGTEAVLTTGEVSIRIR